MREILSRAKSTEKMIKPIGDWVYGFYVCMNGKYKIYNKDFPMEGWSNCRVDPETVGQYIGKLDMSENQIFEGDILYAFMAYGTEIGKVVYNIEAAGYYLETDEGLIGFDELKSSDIVIVGNIYDNPNLLEVKE